MAVTLIEGAFFRICVANLSSCCYYEGAPNYKCDIEMVNELVTEEDLIFGDQYPFIALLCFALSGVGKIGCNLCLAMFPLLAMPSIWLILLFHSFINNLRLKFSNQIQYPSLKESHHGSF